MERRDWMGLLARATPAALERHLHAFGAVPAHDVLRPPETGTVMVRGRTGGVGAPFNLGEVTATRCVLRLADGIEGHAFVQGRNHDHARHAALVDALMQGREAERARTTIVDPLDRIEVERRATVARKAEATRVEFETMVRGDDE